MSKIEHPHINPLADGPKILGGSFFIVDPLASINDDVNLFTPFTTIQGAIDLVPTGSTILVAPNGGSSYLEDLTINNKILAFGSLGVGISGNASPYVDGNIVISGSSSASFDNFYLEKTSGSDPLIDFTATSGYNTLSLRNCYFNYGGTGDAIAFQGDEVYIYDSYLEGSSGTSVLNLVGSTGGQCVSSTFLGLIKIQDASSPTFSNCVFTSSAYFDISLSSPQALQIFNSSVLSGTEVCFQKSGTGALDLFLLNVRLAGSASSWLTNIGGGTVDVNHQSLYVASGLPSPTDSGITFTSNGRKVGGRQSENFILSGVGARPTSTGGADPVTQFTVSGNDFDGPSFPDGSDTSVYWNFTLPLYFESGTTVTAEVHWRTSSASLNSAEFELSAVAFGDSDTLGETLGTPVTITDTNTGANQANISSTSSALTIANVPEGGKSVKFQLTRNGSTDALAASVEVLAVKVNYSSLGIS